MVQGKFLALATLYLMYIAFWVEMYNKADFFAGLFLNVKSMRGRIKFIFRGQRTVVLSRTTQTWCLRSPVLRG